MVATYGTTQLLPEALVRMLLTQPVAEAVRHLVTEAQQAVAAVHVHPDHIQAEVVPEVVEVHEVVEVVEAEDKN